MSKLDRAFEESIFRKMERGQRRQNHTAVAETISFEQDVEAGLLKFDALKKADRHARVVAVERGFDVRLGKHYKALDLARLLQGDNAGVELKFDEDAINFTPDEEMIFKSKVPLWIIKPIGGTRVLITRAW